MLKSLLYRGENLKRREVKMVRKVVIILSVLMLTVFAGTLAWGYPLPYYWEMKFNDVEWLGVPSITWDPTGSPVQVFTGLNDGIEDNNRQDGTNTGME
jgi:hypothetical protein